MSRIFNPSKCVDEQALRAHRGFVSRAKELPVAAVKYFGLVIFCAEDKRFYECQHIITETEDYYKWVAVTSGAQRTFFIPVERLTENETPRVPEPSIRTNCFDAIASALNEMSIGLYRYNIKINPLSYAPCYDATYVDGKKYYVWNDNYDRADYVRTTDIQPIEGKPYFVINSGVYETKIFTVEQSFEDGVIYYESTRPIMIPDVSYSAGSPITHRTFVSDGTAYNDLTKRDLVAKANEIVEIINVTHARLDSATDDGTLYDLAAVVNKIIDEINPFSIPWNKLLQRVEALESGSSKVLDGEIMPSSPTDEQLVEAVKKMFVALGGSIDEGSTPTFVLNPDGTVHTQGEFNPDGTMPFDGTINDDGTVTVEAESESTH